MDRVSLLPLAVGGAAVTVMVIVGVVLAGRGCGSGDHQPAVARPDPAAQVGSAGMVARGTAELRALGCDSAVVLDMQHVLGGAGGVRDGEPRYMVTCDVSATAAAPACERVAAAYFQALEGGGDGNVNVRVAAVGAPRPACSRLFAPSGADLGPFPRAP